MTYLICNSLKKFELILLLTFGIIFSSFAETWDCGRIPETVFCKLSENGTLTVYGNGEMKNYGYVDEQIAGNTIRKSTAPWIDDVKKVEINDGVTSIGAYAFMHASQLTDISGMNSVEKVGHAAFWNDKNLQSIYIQNATIIESQAFEKSGLISAILPNVQTLGNWAFVNASALNYAELSDNVSLGIRVFYGSNITTCKSGTCIGKCTEGYNFYYGYCLRTRYTLPEADEATSDDNENSIEWIFE